MKKDPTLTNKAHFQNTSAIRIPTGTLKRQIKQSQWCTTATAPRNASVPSFSSSSSCSPPWRTEGLQTIKVLSWILLMILVAAAFLSFWQSWLSPKQSYPKHWQHPKRPNTIMTSPMVHLLCPLIRFWNVLLLEQNRETTASDPSQAALPPAFFPS